MERRWSGACCGLLVLRREAQRRIHGAAGRRRAWREWAAEVHAREAGLKVVLICGCLWTGFWLQFVVSFVFNLPALHTLSGGRWWPPGYGYYVAGPGPLPFSIAGNFALAAIAAAVIGLAGGWLCTRGVRGRWRMRVTMLGLAGLSVAWALLAFPAEPAAWKELERRRSETWAKLLMASDRAERYWLRERLESYDRQLRIHGGSGSGRREE